MLSFIKIGFGLLAISAIITEIVVLVGAGTFNLVNFFSYFTVLSNIFAAIVLITDGYYQLRHKPLSINFQWLRGASVLYMTMTGIIFSLLLSGLEGVQLTAAPWDNIVLHYIMPVAVVSFWLIDPPRQTFRIATSLLWLVFPLAYTAYSLIRGAATGWYPYPFLNPSVSGVGGLFVISLAVFIGGCITSALIAWWANRQLALRR